MKLRRERPLYFVVGAAVGSALLGLIAILPAAFFQQAARSSRDSLPGMRGAIVSLDVSAKLDELVAADSARNIVMFRKADGVWKKTGAYRSTLAVQRIALGDAEENSAVLVVTTDNAKVIELETGAIRFDSGPLDGKKSGRAFFNQGLDVFLYRRGPDLIVADARPGATRAAVPQRPRRW